VNSRPRITADLNSGGRDGDTGVVYLGADTQRELVRAGIDLYDGMPLTVSDFDGTPEDPTWLVVEGVVGFDEGANRWEFRYAWDERHWEPRRSA